MNCKIKVFVFTSMDEGQEMIDKWIAKGPLIHIQDMKLTSNKWNICLAVYYKEEVVDEEY